MNHPKQATPKLWRYLKRVALLCCLFSIGSLSAADKEQHILKVHLSDGNSSTYILDNDARITFQNAAMRFSNSEWKVEIPVKNLIKWTYDVQISSANAPVSDSVIINQEGNLLTISGITDSDIYIHTTDGKLVKRFRGTSYQHSINTEQWNPGVYLITVGKSTYKIVKL